jgi:recombination protein RecR
MAVYPDPLERLISELSRLAGIGRKTAQQLAFQILAMSDEEAASMADSIVAAKRELSYCSICGNLTQFDPCDICSDASRDGSVICIVESPKDVIAIEKMREYHGLYHVLHGVIAPMNGIGPEDINIESLIKRLSTSEEVTEVIVATNPNIEGEATAMYLARLIKPAGIKVTRIAHGVPIGGDIEYIDEITLMKAIEGRREL